MGNALPENSSGYRLKFRLGGNVIARAILLTKLKSKGLN